MITKLLQKNVYNPKVYNYLVDGEAQRLKFDDDGNAQFLNSSRAFKVSSPWQILKTSYLLRMEIKPSGTVVIVR